VPAGEAFSDGQRERIDRAIGAAQQVSGLHFSVYVGAISGDVRERAREMLAATGDQQATTVLIAIDPAARCLEVVTGSSAARQLSDHGASLGALAMTTSFLNGDLAGGIVDGLRTMAEHAHQPRTLHTDQP
jgi:hypothetical protein